jgi:hypothetical protein
LTVSEHDGPPAGLWTRVRGPAGLRAAAILAVLAVAGAATGGYLHSRHPAASRPAVDRQRAEEVSDRYRRDTVARLPGQLSFTEASRTVTPCPGRGRYALASQYDLVPGSASVLTVLRAYWKERGYRVLDDTTAAGQTRQLLVENPADGFRIGMTQRTARALRLSISSSCFPLAVAPLAPVLRSDLAGPQAAYQAYVAGQLAQLAGDVGRLRAAVAAGQLGVARSAWLTAQLTWEHVGAAYGSFAELADAIDGLPAGLPRGVADPAFTGLHRIEYGLWHGESRGRLLGPVDRLVRDVAGLRATLPQLTVDPADLPLRAHEILEDALRRHLTGQTDQGSGASLAETYADVAATQRVLDTLAPLIGERRPGLLPAATRGMDALRRALLLAEHGGTWSSLAALPAAVRNRIDAAIGGLLETLALVPGLLELAGS